MTVIFHTDTGSPILAGDMLVSTQGPNADTDLRLPSQPNGITIPSGITPDYVPVSMRRKLFLINDRLAVGVAGTVMQITSFISDIEVAFHRQNNYSFEELDSFLKRYSTSPEGRDVYENIALIFLVEASDRRCSLTKGLNGYHETISQTFGKASAIGTGGSTIIEAIAGFDENYRYGYQQPVNGDETSPEFRPLATNLILIANAYWDEFLSPHNVFRAWGGAYDIVYQDSRKNFKFLEDYTIFLRVFDVDDPTKGLHPISVMKYQRRSDFSLISTMNGSEPAFFGAMDITDRRSSMAISVDREDYEMNSDNAHISIIGVKKGNFWSRPLIQVDGIDRTNDTKPTAFTWIDEEGRLCVAFHAEHDRWLEDQAMEYYRNNAHRFH